MSDVISNNVKILPSAFTGKKQLNSKVKHSVNQKVEIFFRWPTCFWPGLGTGRSVQSFKTEGAPNSDTRIALINLDVAMGASSKQIWIDKSDWTLAGYCTVEKEQISTLHLDRYHHVFHIAHVSLHSVAKIKKTARHKLKHFTLLQIAAYSASVWNEFRHIPATVTVRPCTHTQNTNMKHAV